MSFEKAWAAYVWKRCGIYLKTLEGMTTYKGEFFKMYEAFVRGWEAAEMEAVQHSERIDESLRNFRKHR
jgi:hypothetical protein